MNREIYLINTGEKALKSFIESSRQLEIIEERISFKKASQSAYLKVLGEQYTVLNVYYANGKPIDVKIEPKKYKAKDFEKAYNTIIRELHNFELYAFGGVSVIRGILGQLVAFDTNERENFNRKFDVDKRDSSEIIDEAIADFLPRFERAFGDLILNESPLVRSVKTEIRKNITEQKNTLISQFRKEIEGDIIKDLFKYIIVYTRALREIIEVIRNLIERPGVTIIGESWDPQKTAIKEVLETRFGDVQKDSLTQYSSQLEKLSRENVEDFRNNYLPQAKEEISTKKNEVLESLEEQKEIVIGLIDQKQSNFEAQLSDYQKSFTSTIETKYNEVGQRIDQKTNDAIRAIQNYQRQVIDSLNSREQQYIQNLRKETEDSMLKLQEVREAIQNYQKQVIDSLNNREQQYIQNLRKETEDSMLKLQEVREESIKQFGERLHRKIVEISHILEHLPRREYEIVENLRVISQFVQHHTELNTSVIEYWKNILAHAFTLHTESKDAAIPELTKTVWLNGINQTLGALTIVTHDRLAERAMREGYRYQKIPTTELDCQRVWNRFTAHINRTQSEDMEYLMRRMKAFAEDPSLKNVAVPVILYREGLLEFDRNYHSRNPEEDKSYEEKKRYFKIFFAIAYDEMIQRFRELIMNMVV